MTVTELARLVREMRVTQREYFNPRLRKPDTLERSKQLERQVDKAIEEVLSGQPTLFWEG